MNKQDWIILYLSIVLAISQFLWFKDAKALAYLQGRNSVFATDTVSNDPTLEGP